MIVFDLTFIYCLLVYDQGFRNKAAPGAQRRLLPHYAPPTFFAKKKKKNRIELTLNETSGNSLKCKALLMKQLHIFFFFVSRMLLIVLLSVSKRGAVVISLWKPERIAKPAL